MKRRTTTGERLRTLGFALLALALAGAAAPAAAQDWRPASFFVQGGSGEHDVGAASAGVQWPWAWRTAALGGEFSVRTELFGSVWRARAVGGGRESFHQLGLVPLLRYRFAEGRSPWFLEGGIGLSVTDKRFVSRDKVFGSQLELQRQPGGGPQLRRAGPPGAQPAPAAHLQCRAEEAQSGAQPGDAALRRRVLIA